jgi:hypothetical protein
MRVLFLRLAVVSSPHCASLTCDAEGRLDGATYPGGLHDRYLQQL